MARYILIIIKLNIINLADIIYWEVVFKYKTPYRIIFDRGPVFISEYWLKSHW